MATASLRPLSNVAGLRELLQDSVAVALGIARGFELAGFGPFASGFVAATSAASARVFAAREEHLSCCCRERPNVELG